MTGYVGLRQDIYGLLKKPTAVCSKINIQDNTRQLQGYKIRSDIGPEMRRTLER